MLVDILKNVLNIKNTIRVINYKEIVDTYETFSMQSLRLFANTVFIYF